MDGERDCHKYFFQGNKYSTNIVTLCFKYADVSVNIGLIWIMTFLQITGKTIKCSRSALTELHNDAYLNRLHEEELLKESLNND